MKPSAIAKAGGVLLAFRLVGLGVRYVVQPTGPLASRVGIFAAASVYHAGALLCAIGLCVALGALLPRARGFVAAASVALFLLLTIGGQLDLTLSWITGEPLTPTVFRTFRGFYIVRSPEFLEPLKANLALALAGGTALLVATAGMIALVVPGVRRRDAPRPTFLGAAGMVCCGVVLMAVGAHLPWSWAQPPVEVAFAREYLGLDALRPMRSDAAAVRSLRAMLGLPEGASWLSDDYPLVYGWPHAATSSGAARASLPDIVVVFIESLRAENLGYMHVADEPSATPNLDALASKGVVFTGYISNGFPTAPATVAFHGSGWPHRTKEVVTDFVDRHFDVLPDRLRDLGYDTRYIGADPHLDREHLLLPRWYDRALDLAGAGLSASDRNTIHMTIEEIKHHDQDMPAQPLFAFIATLTTHYPFMIPEDGEDLAVAPEGETMPERYRRTLRYTDRQIGELTAFLDTRARKDNTITIVTGDHAFYLDLTRTSGLPENDNEWTSAIFSGPERFVGPPRAISDPASHADIEPTLLAIVGDRRPSASLGGNLFGPARNGSRQAVAVRPGGVRLDRGGYSYMVDARTPSDVLIRPAFPFSEAHGKPAAVDPVDLSDWATEYSVLIERDRVWNGDFLKR